MADDGAPLALGIQVPELDLSNAPGIRDELRGLIERQDRGDVMIDMSAVTFVDSSGIGALVMLRNAAEGRGGSLSLRRLQPQPYQVLGLTGLLDILHASQADPAQEPREIEDNP